MSSNLCHSFMTHLMPMLPTYSVNQWLGGFFENTWRDMVLLTYLHSFPFENVLTTVLGSLLERLSLEAEVQHVVDRGRLSNGIMSLPPSLKCIFRNNCRAVPGDELGSM